MLRKDEAYRDVYLLGYKVDDVDSGEILDSLLSGICPVCGDYFEYEVKNFGKVGDRFEWGCPNCIARVDIETTR